MSKRVGILTFHKSLNYGSALQAYALLSKLGELGYEAEIIDYKQYNYEFLYTILRAPVSLLNIKYNIIHLCFLRTLLKRQKAFPSFWGKYFYLSSKKYQHGDDMRILGDEYDVIICGSDQIWNPNAGDFDRNYFLPEIKNAVKVSYAASLNGSDLASAPISKKLKQYLLEFDALSVRENSGRETLDKFLNGKKKVSVVLDPTLLYQKEKYDTIVSPRLVSEKYIFFYSVNFKKDAVQAAENLSKRTGLPVYTLFAGRGNKQILKAKRKFHFMRDAVGPEDFLSLLKHADYVVTNSFHGTAFSIIYEKKFYSIGCTDESGMIQYDERICDGLSLLGLTDRFITKEEIKSIDVDAPIKFEQVQERRNREIHRSITYIRDAVL